MVYLANGVLENNGYKILEQIITSNEGDKNKYKTKLISVWKFADDAPSLHRKIVREVEFALDIKNDEGLDIETTNQESLSTTDGATLFSIKKVSKQKH